MSDTDAPAQGPGAVADPPARGLTPLLVDAAGVASVLCISRTSLFGLLASGRLPLPVLRVGRLVRWSVDQLRAWIGAGCPPRERFAILAAGGGRA